MARASLSAVDEIARQPPNGTVTSATRRYTVNATITLAGIPLFSKKNVGGACISVEDSTCPEYTVTALQFAAGSWPERLKGFNRFGMTQEIVREQAGTVAESAYVSFMSSSPEKNLAEARHAFASQEVVPLTIAVGHSSSKGSAVEVEHSQVPGTYSWRNCQEIVDGCRENMQFPAETVSGTPTVLPTFLFAVRRAMLANNGVPVRYAHNAKRYHLTTHTEAEAQAGHTVVNGRISAESDHGDTDFNLWMPTDDAAALPVRIQWRARSFLVLTLEVDDSSAVPVLHSMLNREHA